jgi:Flp pilus assembly protein TadG
MTQTVRPKMTALTMARSRLRDEGGQALVEFALLLPVLLLLIIGIVEFGRAWNIKQVITDAAREGARKAAVYEPTYTIDTVTNAIKTTLAAGGVNPGAPTVIDVQGFSRPTINSNFPTTVTVKVPYSFPFFGPMFRYFMGRDMNAPDTLSSSSTMRIE